MLSLEEKEFPKWLSVLSYSLKKFKDCIEMGLIFGSSIKVRDFNDIDVLLNKEDKIFYNILSESLVFHNPEKYAEVIRECRK